MTRPVLAILLALSALVLGACSGSEDMSSRMEKKYACTSAVLVEKKMSISAVAAETLPSDTWGHSGIHKWQALQDWTRLVIVRSQLVGSELQPGDKVKVPVLCKEPGRT